MALDSPLSQNPHRHGSVRVKIDPACWTYRIFRFPWSRASRVRFPYHMQSAFLGAFGCCQYKAAIHLSLQHSSWRSPTPHEMNTLSQALRMIMQNASELNVAHFLLLMMCIMVWYHKMPSCHNGKKGRFWDIQTLDQLSSSSHRLNRNERNL